MFQTRVFDYRNGKWEPIYVLGKCGCDKDCGHGDTWINYTPPSSIPNTQIIGPSWEQLRSRLFGI